MPVYRTGANTYTIAQINRGDKTSVASGYANSVGMTNQLDQTRIKETLLYPPPKDRAKQGLQQQTNPDALIVAGIVADAGAVQITGSDVGLISTRKLVIDSGSPAGTFTITGAVAILSHGFTLPADAGAFGITGAAVGLSIARILPVVPGGFTITGTDAGFIFTHQLIPDSGGFVIAGPDATLTQGGSSVTYTRHVRGDGWPYTTLDP